MRPVATARRGRAARCGRARSSSTRRAAWASRTPDGRGRIDRARAAARDRAAAGALGRVSAPRCWRFGEALAPPTPTRSAATARRSDLAGALAAVRERYRGRPVAGIVLLSDGGDTSGRGAPRPSDRCRRSTPIGIGAPDGRARSRGAERHRRRSGPGRLARRSRGVGGRATAQRHRADRAAAARERPAARSPPRRAGRRRRAGPATSSTSSPARGAATVYTVEIPAAAGELGPGEQPRSVLVQPPSRPRRVLLVEGAPGFEHSFLKRALARRLAASRSTRSSARARTSRAPTRSTSRRRARAATRSIDRLSADAPSARSPTTRSSSPTSRRRSSPRAQLEATRDFVGAARRRPAGARRAVVPAKRGSSARRSRKCCRCDSEPAAATRRCRRGPSRGTNRVALTRGRRGASRHAARRRRSTRRASAGRPSPRSRRSRRSAGRGPAPACWR